MRLERIEIDLISFVIYLRRVVGYQGSLSKLMGLEGVCEKVAL